MAKLPSPIQGGGNPQQQRSIVEQLLISLVGQAPNLVLGLMNQQQQNRAFNASQAEKAAEDQGQVDAFAAAFPTLAGMGGPTGDIMQQFAARNGFAQPNIQGATSPDGSVSMLPVTSAPAATRQAITSSVSPDAAKALLSMAQQTEAISASRAARQNEERRLAMAEELHPFDVRMRTYEEGLQPTRTALLDSELALSKLRERGTALDIEAGQFNLDKARSEHTLNVTQRALEARKTFEDSVMKFASLYANDVLPGSGGTRQLVDNLATSILQRRSSGEFVSAFMKYDQMARSGQGDAAAKALGDFLGGNIFFEMAGEMGLPGADAEAVLSSVQSGHTLNEVWSENFEEIKRMTERGLMTQEQADGQALQLEMLLNAYRASIGADPIKFFNVTSKRRRAGWATNPIPGLSQMNLSPIVGR